MSMLPALTQAYAPHILVVDDDARLRELLCQFLSKQGWMVSLAQDAKEARQMLAMVQVDLMVLDVMMPQETGVQLARSLREDAAIATPPILMLTAMNEVDDRIAGLESGVDDYVVKPFEPRELVLRIESILRRTYVQKQQEQSISFGDFVLHMQRKQLLQGEEVVHLTETEMAVLIELARAGGEAVSRDSLLQHSDVMAGGGERSVDVQITRLRRRIEPEPARPRYIHTVRGLGYVLRV
jgi:two-component system phosphate regulon response regulator OmpR